MEGEDKREKERVGFQGGVSGGGGYGDQGYEDRRANEMERKEKWNAEEGRESK